MIKLGSLFDGIGVFPLYAEEEGIIPAWASEIEPFPIQVTKRHFPNMKHLGDITKINGAEIEPVDIITFGSPCQDVSMAGKRKGINFTGKYISRKSVRLIKKKPHEFDGFRRYLINTRSGLFLEAVRIIREMRSATDGRYPRFAIWENVPGVLSSNNGRDFRTVLEELLETEIPISKSAKWIKTKTGREQKLIWANAGMVRGDGRSLAWRILDAQYFGVPQRRRRIFLVADFRGQCAAEILFESQSVPGHSSESGSEREEAAGTPGNGIEAAGGTEYLTGWDNQEKRIFGVNGVSPTLAGSDGGGGRTGVGYIAQCLTSGTGRRYDPETETLIPIMIENHPADSRVKIDDSGKAQTLTSRMGTGGGNVPMVMEPKAIGCDVYNLAETGDKAATLTAYNGSHSSGPKLLEPVAFQPGNLSPTSGGRTSTKNEELSGTLQAKNSGGT